MKLSTAWHWELGIGILEDNVFGLRENKPSSDPLLERRREPRISLSLPVRFRPKEKKFGWFAAQSIDVSRNGVRLSLGGQVQVGQQIDLDIKLPDVQKTVRLEGVVVWANPSQNGMSMECGIAFKSLRKLTQKEKIMYFMADKICSMADRNSSQFTCYPARSTADLDKAYRLVYKEYLQKNYCSENPAKMHYTYYSLMPESRTFLLERTGNFVGTISLIPDSEAGLPLETIFPKEIKSFRGPGRKLAEVSLLALDGASFERRTFSLTDFQKLTGSFRLFKILFDYARFVAGVTDLVIGMHPKHKELYKYLHFEEAGPVRSYPGAEGKPALLMRMDIEQKIRTVGTSKGAASYFLRNSITKEELERRFDWTPATVHDFLYGRKALINSLSEKQIAHLRHYYPGLCIIENGIKRTD